MTLTLLPDGGHHCRVAQAMMGLSDMDKMVSEAVLSEQATTRGSPETSESNKVT